METTLSPWLIVADDAKSIEFYEAAFGATVLYRVPGGGVAQLEIDGAEFWISDATATHNRVTPSELASRDHWILLSVEDPDTVWQRAVAAGATADEPVSESRGWRSGTVIDADGHQWTIGKPIPDGAH